MLLSLYLYRGFQEPCTLLYLLPFFSLSLSLLSLFQNLLFSPYSFHHTIFIPILFSLSLSILMYLYINYSPPSPPPPSSPPLIIIPITIPITHKEGWKQGENMKKKGKLNGKKERGSPKGMNRGRGSHS